MTKIRSRKDGSKYPLAERGTLFAFMDSAAEDRARTLAGADTRRPVKKESFREPDKESLRGDSLNSYVEASKTKPLFSAAAAFTSPKADRLNRLYPTQGSKVLEKYAIDNYNDLSAHEFNGKYYIWVSSPYGGARVTTFGKDKQRMLDHLQKIKENVMAKHQVRAQKELPGKRRMAEVITTHSSEDSTSTKQFLKHEISKEFLSDGQFKALFSEFEKTKDKNSDADRLLASYLTEEALVRGIDLIGPTKSVPARL